MPAPSSKPPGLILAGGAARRLGGGDKGLHRLGATTVLAHIVGRLGPQCDGLLIGANGDAARLASLGCPIVGDDPADAGLGPLAGLLAGFDHLARGRPGATALVTVPGDVPFLPHDLVPRLSAERDRTGAAVAAARSAGRDHPLASLWSVALREDLRRALRNEGLRRVGAFLERHAVAWVDWPAEPLDPFFNINTPDDLALARHLASGGAPGAADAEGDDRSLPLD